MWNVESEVDIPHEAYPWKVLPREKKSGAKLPAELPKAAWDILEQHAEDQEEGITASLRNGHRCQEMPDVGAPYTYIYSATSSSKQASGPRSGMLRLKQEGGGTFHQVYEANGQPRVDDQKCARSECPRHVPAR